MEDGSHVLQIMLQSSFCVFGSVAIAIKIGILKNLPNLKLEVFGSWSYEVLLADVVWRFPVTVYNMLEIV